MRRRISIRSFLRGRSRTAIRTLLRRRRATISRPYRPSSPAVRVVLFLSRFPRLVVCGANPSSAADARFQLHGLCGRRRRHRGCQHWMVGWHLFRELHHHDCHRKLSKYSDNSCHPRSFRNIGIFRQPAVRNSGRLVSLDLAEQWGRASDCAVDGNVEQRAKRRCLYRALIYQSGSAHNPDPPIGIGPSASPIRASARLFWDYLRLSIAGERDFVDPAPVSCYC